MKRYRVLTLDFDTRANILKINIEPDWSPEIQAQWRTIQANIKERLVAEFGALESDRKLRDFIDAGPAPFSIVAFHNRFFRQARTAFVAGAYYPALTAACALGERILNHLVLALRDDFRTTPQYKTVAGKDSFDNWDLAADTLDAWDVLLPSVVEHYRGLRDVRHRALHFNPETDKNDRSLALNALGLLTDIVREQFSAIEQRPWFIPHRTSIAFVRKDSETTPFVARVILPNCARVGPRHRLKGGQTTPWVVEDEEYAAAEISDEEFIRQFEERGSG